MFIHAWCANLYFSSSPESGDMFTLFHQSFFCVGAYITFFIFVTIRILRIDIRVDI